MAVFVLQVQSELSDRNMWSKRPHIFTENIFQFPVQTSIFCFRKSLVHDDEHLRNLQNPLKNHKRYLYKDTRQQGLG